MGDGNPVHRWPFDSREHGCLCLPASRAYRAHGLTSHHGALCFRSRPCWPRSKAVWECLLRYRDGGQFHLGSAAGPFLFGRAMGPEVGDHISAVGPVEGLAQAGLVVEVCLDDLNSMGGELTRLLGVG